MVGFTRAWAVCAILLAASAVCSAATTPAGAFLRSLVLPGWGQLAVGAPGRATAFAAVEGALFAGIAGTRIMRGIYRDDYRSLASAVAGASIAGKGDEYFSDLAFYDTRAHHNQAALVYDQPNPTFYGPHDDWQWPTTADRMRYREYWNDSRRMDQRLDFLFFAVSLNHLASAVDAAKRASTSPDGSSTRPGLIPRFAASATPDRAVLEWRWAF